MDKGSLHTAIKVMSRHVVECPVTQIHAQPLQVRDFHHVGIRRGKFNPLFYRGTITQGLLGLGRHEHAVRLMGKGERDKQ